MPRHKSVKASPSITSEGDLEGFEVELEKLQRTYRIMDGDRQAYVLESQDILRRHQSEIELLKQERTELLKNLNVAQSKKKRLDDQFNILEIQRLLEEKDTCLIEIEEEKFKHSQFQTKINKWEQILKEQRKVTVNHGVIENSPQLSHKRISVLENRLHVALTKFNTALTKNASLREEMETLRIEKGKFQHLYKKCEKDLTAIKKQIGQVIEASTLAYDQRDEAHSKILLLKEKADKDLQLFNAEMKELQRVLNHEKRLRDFMLAKGFSRVGKKTMTRKDTEKKKGEGGSTIENFESAFQEIECITGTNNIDVIVENFIKIEDSNFALFNFVNEQNNEIEKLQDSINKLQRKIVQLHNEGLKLDSDRTVILDELECEAISIVKKSKENEALLSTTNKILDQLKIGIGSLFEKVGCDRGILSDLLGSSEEVKDDNMMQYLGLIEQRANELLAAQSFIDAEENRFDSQDAPPRIILGQVPVTPVDQLLIAPPSTGDEFESDAEIKNEDDDSRPLTQKELKERIIKVVLKKEEVASKKDNRYDLGLVKKVK